MLSVGFDVSWVHWDAELPVGLAGDVHPRYISRSVVARKSCRDCGSLLAVSRVGENSFLASVIRGEPSITVSVIGVVSPSISPLPAEEGGVRMTRRNAAAAGLSVAIHFFTDVQSAQWRVALNKIERSPEYRAIRTRSSRSDTLIKVAHAISSERRRELADT